MNDNDNFFGGIFTDFFKNVPAVGPQFQLWYDDGTRNVALTRPTTSAVNVATARQVLNECSHEELKETYWAGFNTNHVFVHTIN